MSPSVLFEFEYFRRVLENIKRNISCSLTYIDNCALDEIIDKTCYRQAGQRQQDNMAHVYYVLDN
jgi:hypothetical protein